MDTFLDIGAVLNRDLINKTRGAAASFKIHNKYHTIPEYIWL